MCRMKTIWLVYPYGILSSGTQEIRQLRYGRKLAEHGYRVIFWTSNFSHESKTFVSDVWKKVKIDKNLYMELVPTSSYKKNISLRRVLSEFNYAKNLKNAIYKTEEPDLIITSGTGMSSAFWPVWPYMQEKNVPVIYDIMDITMFDTFIGSKSKLLVPMGKAVADVMRKREWNFYHHVSAITGLGKHQVDYAVERTGNKNIPHFLLYNSIHVKEFRTKMKKNLPVSLPEKKDREIWCIYAGSLGPSYDLKGLIEAAEIAERRKDNLRFIVAGMGPEDYLIREADKRLSNLTFLGKMDVNDLPALYKRCDIGLCTYGPFSTVDMPDKFYDYTAAGLAMVSSLKGESVEHILKAKAGVQYKAGDSEDLYKKICEVSENIEEYKKNSYDLAEYFDFDKRIGNFLQMVDEVCR